MIDESKCYEILGVTAGVSRQELKAAHRDLAKVWHPDRFAYDPRLQEKAQEKLKEINEAFDQLTSGKPKRRPVSPPPASNAAWSHHPRRARHSQPTHWRLVFAALLIFVAMFFFTSRSLIRRNLQQAQDAVSSSTEQIPAVEIDDGQSGNRGGAGGSERGGKKIGERGTPQNSDVRQMTGADAVQPMATVTVTIDQATGLLARRDCPTKRTMTYPRGSEPKQYCNIHMPLDPARTEGELRVKSAAKRVVSPDKW
jgi:DnaJ domain